MSRAEASASHSGRSGNPKVTSSNPDLAVFKPWSSQTIDFKIIFVAPYSGTRHYLDKARTGWLSVRIM